MWDGKKSYLNIIVNDNERGDERLEYTKSGDEYRNIQTDYRWLGCSVNAINTEHPKYCAAGVRDGKYMTWEFDRTIDLSDAKYIVLAFSEANRSTVDKTQVLEGDSNITTLISGGIGSVSKDNLDIEVQVGQGINKNLIYLR